MSGVLGGGEQQIVRVIAGGGGVVTVVGAGFRRGLVRYLQCLDFT